MPNDLPKAKLENFWLTKRYTVDGKDFTFFWGVTALGWDDAFRQVSSKEFTNLTKGDNWWMWFDGKQGHACSLTKGAYHPECLTGENFSVRDDQIKKPLPKQIVFNL